MILWSRRKTRSMSTIARSSDASAFTRTLMLSIFFFPITRCSAVRSGMNAAESGLLLPNPPPMLSKMPMISNGWPFTAMILPTRSSGFLSSRCGTSEPSTTTRLRSPSSSALKNRPTASL